MNAACARVGAASNGLSSAPPNALFELKFFRALSIALTFTRMYKALNMDKK
jgi:hypothetical protein